MLIGFNCIRPAKIYIINCIFIWISIVYGIADLHLLTV